MCGRVLGLAAEDFVFVCRALCDCNPGASDEQRRLFVELLHTIERLGLAAKFPTEVGLMRQQLDRALQLASALARQRTFSWANVSCVF